jgi:predicted amidohydrolase YtcJ
VALASCALLAWLVNATCAAASTAPADVVFVNGHVLTLDATGSEVEAVAVRDGRIVATGRNRLMRRLVGPETEVVDLQGRTVVPGFVDGHAHAALAVRMMERYLDGRFASTPSVAVLLQKIAARAAVTPAGQWLIVAGSSSSQTRFAERRLPTRTELDQAALDVPVMFLNGSHEAVVNSAGVRTLGLQRNMRELKGAAIDLDADGEPTGVVREGLMIFPDLRIPPDDLKRYYARAIPELWNAAGYTSVYTLAPLDQLPVLRELAQGSPTTLRYTIGLHADPGGRLLPASFAALKLSPTVDSTWYRVAGIKVWVDSDVPMRGGAVREPYAGDPGAHGILNLSQSDLEALVLRTRGAGRPARRALRRVHAGAR